MKNLPKERETVPKILLAGLLGTNLLLRLLIVIRPLEYIDGLVIPDDAYLSLTIARNIANGLGPLYGFDHTNGFQPLYAFFMVPVYWLLSNDLVTPVHIALVLLAFFDTASLFFLYKLVSSFSASLLTPVFVAVVWILNPYIIRTSLNGLETIISFFFLIVVFFCFYEFQFMSQENSLKQASVLGVLLGLAVLARIDSAFQALAIVSMLLIGYLQKRQGFPHLIKTLIVILLGILVTTLPWFLYSFYYTGDVYQISGEAARFMPLAQVDYRPTLINWYLPMLVTSSIVILVLNWVPLALLCGLFIALSFIKGNIPVKAVLKKFKRYNVVLLFSVFLFVAYTFYVFTFWYFDRYFFPVILLFLLYLAVLVDLCVTSVEKRRVKLIFKFAVLVLIVCVNLLQPGFWSLYFSQDTKSLGYMNLGIWARTNFQDGTTIGSSQTGALGYFADNLQVINLDGVVNKACYESLTQQRNMDYIRDVGIEYVLGWQENIDFIKKNSSNFSDDDLVFLNKIDEFKSWGHDWYLYKVNYDVTTR